MDSDQREPPESPRSTKTGGVALEEEVSTPDPGEPTRTSYGERAAQRELVRATAAESEHEEQAESYDEAVDVFVRHVGDLRRRFRSRQMSEPELEAERDRFVGQFVDSSDGRLFRKLLKGPGEFAKKVDRLVDIALSLPYWDARNFNRRYEQKYGDRITDLFDDQERVIVDRILRASEEIEASHSGQA